jgi:hypothetical protein
MIQSEERIEAAVHCRSSRCALRYLGLLRSEYITGQWAVGSVQRAVASDQWSVTGGQSTAERSRLRSAARIASLTTGHWSLVNDQRCRLWTLDFGL